jgi:adenine-specific DNA-methyltransferase
MKNLLDILNEIFRNQTKYADSNGNLLKEKIQQEALNLNVDLISLLLSDLTLKNEFFVKIDNFFVFDKVKFYYVIKNKEFLPDNYTRFKNYIGLVDKDEDFLTSKEDVFISFPNKDCLIEFDSTKEDEDRPERFFNELLNKNEIDTLLEPKLLTNHVNFPKNNSNNLSGNLLIKGNNLLALHTLKYNYYNKIKLMYWDVLYNTMNDNVPYNDSIKHSSWLTMMKNRLIVARELLREDGVIFIQLDYNEQAYLKVLMDEIFKDGYVGLITVKTSSESGVKVNSNKPIKTSEYLLIYAKNKERFIYKHPKVITGYDKNYKYVVKNREESIEKWKIINFKDYASELLNKKSSSISDKELEKIQIDNCERIFSVRDISNNLKDHIIKNKIDTNLVHEYITSTGKKTLLYKNGEIVFIEKKVIDINGVKFLTKLASDIWTDISWDGIANEGGIKLKNGKKPERLLQRIIESTTNENDIVLDAYFGSGTTGAVCMKTNRKFIGIEQLSSHFDLSIQRLSNVINGDSTGISKDTNWKGGSDFSALELKKLNQFYIDKITSIDTNADLIEIFDEIIQSPFVVHTIDLNKVSKKDLIQNNLSAVEIKDLLLRILDKNMLYVNLSDIDNKSLGINEEDIKISKLFYGDLK